MNTQFLKLRATYLLGLISLFNLCIGTTPVRAQAQGGALKTWATIQETVKEMETAVQTKNLHGIHDASMKIRAPIRALKAHSSMLSADKGQTFIAALKGLDDAVTDLHSAADEGNQAQAEAALKNVERALDQLKAQDPETAFKGM
ncbi:MAG: hypothetical protein JO025_02340 [Verrucomicrobia bacterium]|nr:hypothetical protein [Verrucomicrobiota bacterium]